MDITSSRLNTCRCCLMPLSYYEKPVRVSEEIAMKFFELTSIELKLSDPTTSLSCICATCDLKLTDFYNFRSELQRLHNQNILIDPDSVPVKVEYDSDVDTGDFEMTDDMMTVSLVEQNTHAVFSGSQSARFCCEYCSKCYKYRDSLARHIRVAHENPEEAKSQRLPQKNLCSICAKIVKGGKSGLEEHMLMAHSEEFNFICDLCPKKAKTRRNLEKHMKSHISQEFREKFLCAICSAPFTAKRSLDRHTLMRHMDLPKIFKCDCGKAFKTKEHLRYHFSQMHNLGTFPCPHEECPNKVFPTKVKLNCHIREFHAEKTPCNVCGKMVGGRRTMIKHIKTHGPPEFKCTYDNCTKEFFGKEALRNHIATKHDRSETFICPTCGSAFATLKNMKKHILRQHEAEKIPCGVQGCKHSSTRKDYLAAHYRAHKDIDEETRNLLIAGIKDIQGIAW